MPPPKLRSEKVLKYIRQNFDYSPVTGKLYKFRKRSGNFVEYEGSLKDSGYYIISFRLEGEKHNITKSAICWYLHYGEWPDMEIDHIDRNKRNNRISNLRKATRALNSANKYKKSGLPVGVGFHPRRKSRPYQAQIYNRGKREHLGMFATPEEAHEAYNKRYKEIYGEDFEL